MQALEFKSSIKGNTLEIPPHLAAQVPKHSQVKIIMLLEEPPEHQPNANLQQRLMEISRRCASIPNKDERNNDEILGYDEQGMPS